MSDKDNEKGGEISKSDKKLLKQWLSHPILFQGIKIDFVFSTAVEFI